jgi:hypothetical protein
MNLTTLKKDNILYPMADTKFSEEKQHELTDKGRDENRDRQA